MTKKIRHVLGISGGKDSAALAIYMRDKVPEMEYFFTDTGAEVPETTEFLDLLEVYLGKPIARLQNERPFEHLLKNLYNDFLPSQRSRWCTREMKIKPFEKFVGDDECITYVGIRADEDRVGYISTKPNITARFPFKEDGLVKEDIYRLISDAGLELPGYYKWRSRSGCYFCFYQRKSEWVGLLEHHPDLFEKAKAFEKFDPITGERFTWNQGESLDELAARADEIKSEAQRKLEKIKVVTWQERLAADEDDEDPEDRSCLICSL